MVIVQQRENDMWKACPECGNIQDLRELKDHKSVCYKCRALGFQNYLLSVPELIMHAESSFYNGQKLRDIALNLVRQAAIWECIEKACDEYREAQREGLNSHASWKCARDGMNELLK